MKNINKWIIWCFVLFWMGNILSFSSQPAEISKKQSGFFVAIVQEIIVSMENKLDITLINTNQLDHYVRKTAHVFNYFILMFLLLFAAYSTNTSKKYPYIGSLRIAFLFSIFDELFQTFIPGRSGMFRDVLIDQIGAVIAFLLFYSVIKRRKLVNTKTNSSKLA